MDEITSPTPARTAESSRVATGSKLEDKIATFWGTQIQEMEKLQDFKSHQKILPIARIKKIMKSDEDVRLISGEVPILFSKACQLFIEELTLRAWHNTEEAKRRTLQRSDIAAAISRNEAFDFLIDIVPREESYVRQPLPEPDVTVYNPPIPYIPTHSLPNQNSLQPLSLPQQPQQPQSGLHSLQSLPLLSPSPTSMPLQQLQPLPSLAPRQQAPLQPLPRLPPIMVESEAPPMISTENRYHPYHRQHSIQRFLENGTPSEFSCCIFKANFRKIIYRLVLLPSRYTVTTRCTERANNPRRVVSLTFVFRLPLPDIPPT